MLMHRQSAQSD